MKALQRYFDFIDRYPGECGIAFFIISWGLLWISNLHPDWDLLWLGVLLVPQLIYQQWTEGSESRQRYIAYMPYFGMTSLIFASIACWLF